MPMGGHKKNELNLFKSVEISNKQSKDPHTVESGYIYYNEHGYNEIAAIAKSFPGTEFFSVIFNVIKYGYNEFGYSEIMFITKAGCPPN